MALEQVYKDLGREHTHQYRSYPAFPDKVEISACLSRKQPSILIEHS